MSAMELSHPCVEIESALHFAYIPYPLMVDTLPPQSRQNLCRSKLTYYQE